MQSTTTLKLPFIEQARRTVALDKAALVLVIVLLLLACFSDLIHQALDANYRQILLRETENNRVLDEALKRIEHSSEGH